MLTDEEVQTLIKAVEAKTIFNVFDWVNQAAVDWKNQKAGQSFRTINASGDEWQTQLVLLGPN